MVTEILVVGGTGTVGRELLGLLSDRDVTPRVLLRPGSELPGSIQDKVEIIRGDLAQEDSLRAALSGIDQVFLLSRDQPRQAELEENLVRIARQQSVRKIIKSSAFAAGLQPPVGYGINHARVEKYLIDSGMEWVIQRPFVFMQNLLDVADVVNNRGLLPLPFGKANIALIDARDVAFAASRLLLDYRVSEKIFEFTGPDSLTMMDCARILSEVLQKQLTYHSPPFWLAGLMMRMQGVSSWDVKMRKQLFAMVREGGEANTSPDFETVCERKPIDFRRFAKDYAEDFLRA